jgi:hypothetical protein
MEKLCTFNPLKKKPEKKSVAELKIAEGNMMKKIETASKELTKLKEELDHIRRVIDDKQS